MSKQYSVEIDPVYGFRRLHPLPSNEDLEEFYEDEYYRLTEHGGRAPDLRRLMREDTSAQREIEWMAQTWWSDILDILNKTLTALADRALLDFGCGTGHFAHFMQKSGWHTVGVEPSVKALNKAQADFGLCAYPTLADCELAGVTSFHAVTLLNVLEHLVDPVRMIKQLRQVLKPEGVLVIRVPNDFSELQEVVCEKLDKEPWWIAVPDHLHYFTFDTLEELLEEQKFEIIERISDFPMELFLLLGDDYIGNPEKGSECHLKRVSLELSLPVELRRKLYRSFAENGLGRNALVFARKT